VPSWKHAATKRRRPKSAEETKDVIDLPTIKARYSPLKDDFVAKGRERRQSVPNVSRQCASSKQVRTRGVISAPRLRRRTLPQIEALPASSRPSVKLLPAAVQIPRKHYTVVKAIFDEHDEDGDGHITLEEFIEAVSRSDQRKAEDERERIRKKFFDEHLGDTVAMLAEDRYLKGSQAQKQHAAAMFLSVTSKNGAAQISLLDFMCMYFPHLSRAAVKRACDKYKKPPPPPAKKKTLGDVAGAREEVAQVFAGLDSDGDGLVRMRSLEPLMARLGISKQDLQDWLAELPPALQRARNHTLVEGSSLTRMKSKINLQDMEKLLEPVFLPKSPKAQTKDQIAAQIERAQALALDAVYGGIH